MAMAYSKRRIEEEQDPDYADIRNDEANRPRLLVENGKTDYVQKVRAVLKREFDIAVLNKRYELREIQERLCNTQKVLHLLRSVLVSSYYQPKQKPDVSNSDQPKKIHPAIKKLLGKGPPPLQFLEDRRSRLRQAVNQLHMLQSGGVKTSPKKQVDSPISTKVPRYITPNIPTLNGDDLHEPRGAQHKVKIRLIIGNISKWIPVESRHDDASHKWMMYVRGPKDAADVSDFVSKVRFFLHPSFKPNDVVEVSSPPFHLVRRGWGEFPVKVQIHFCHPLNRPVDVIHQLKLDQTQSGLQTLGAETIVDIWLYRSLSDSTPQLTEGHQSGTPQSNCTVSEKIDVEPPGVTLYEESGHRTIVHDNSLIGEIEIKEEMIDESSIGEIKIKKEKIDEIPICETRKGSSGIFSEESILSTEIEIKEEPPGPSAESNHLGASSSTFNHDCFGSSLPSPSDQIVHEEMTVESHNESVLKKTSYPPDNELSKNYLTSDAYNLNISAESYNSKTLPSSSDSLVSNILETEKVLNCNDSKRTQIPSLLKPTKMIRCMDEAGNIFYVNLTVPNSKAQSKVASNLVGGVESNISTATMACVEANLNSNSLISRGYEHQQKFFNLSPKVKNLSPESSVGGPVMNSLLPSRPRMPTAPSISLLKNYPVSSNSSSVSNAVNKSIVSPELASNFQIKSVMKPSTSSVLQGISSVDLSEPVTAGSLQRSFLKSPSKSKVLTSSDNSTLHAQGQRQSLWFGENRQLFDLKQSPSVSALSAKSNQSSLCGGKISQEEMIQTSHVSSSVLQTGVSLLKNSIVPVKADNSAEKSFEGRTLEMEEEKLIFGGGRKMVLNKANSQNVVCSKKETSEEKLKAVIKCCKFDDIRKSINWLLRHFPLAHPEACYPEFKALHPYAAPNEAAFLQWNHGKRKAAEWQRAKAVRCALQQVGYTEEETWSTRNIIIWAKLHGYTPLLSEQTANEDTPPSVNERQIKSSCSEPVKIREWLKVIQEEDQGNLEEDVEVDVERLSPPPVKVKEESVDSLEDMLVMEFDRSDLSDCLFVRETARELGIKFPPCQIIPGVVYCAAERLLVQAMRSFVEDMLRRSLRMAWRRNSDRQPDCIELRDITAVLLNRPEFDMFTNIGLGAQPIGLG